ncbi:MAG TPA: LysM peptidoglycan-binding domain-containing protein [Kribbella sp.]|nr:LysM peptidoglycan-binding domain-containing protein [Kribbella sp.]
MNAMIRVAKGTLAVAALAGLGLALRWMTAGSISGVNSHDLDSMTVLAVGTVAWMAYGWLLLAVVVTVLEQLPGAIGALAGAIAGRITSQTARTLLRSSLGVAAVTPLTVGVAHATPGDGSVQPWTQVERHSSVQVSGTTSATNWRAPEPGSTVHLAAPTHPLVAPAGTTDWRATEPPSTVRLTEQTPPQPSQSASGTDTPTPTPERLVATNSTHPTTTAPTPRPRPGIPSDGVPTRPTTTGTPADGLRTPDGVPGGRRVRVGVPDRPAVGAATRYTDLRSGVPVRVPGRVVVEAGDSLWSIAARELGPHAGAEAIAARWPEWYAANRQVIGSDPDLILPGQVLRIPAAADRHVPPTHQEK